MRSRRIKANWKSCSSSSRIKRRVGYTVDIIILFNKILKTSANY